MGNQTVLEGRQEMGAVGRKGLEGMQRWRQFRSVDCFRSPCLVWVEAHGYEVGAWGDGMRQKPDGFANCALDTVALAAMVRWLRLHKRQILEWVVLSLRILLPKTPFFCLFC